MDTSFTSRPQTLKLRLNGREQTIDIARQGEALRVLIDGNEQRAWISHRHGHTVVLDVEQADGSTQRLRVVGAAAGDQRQVWINGRMVSYERARPQGQTAATADSSLASTIPAVVAQILVAPGDSVQAGDKLILLESMKMVIPIQAPYDGRVQQINCAVGDSIAAGIPLLELEQTTP